MTHLWQLFLRDIYDPIWPNIAASAILYFAMTIKLNALKRFHKKQHDDLKAHMHILHEATKQHITDIMNDSGNADKTFLAGDLTPAAE